MKLTKGARIRRAVLASAVTLTAGVLLAPQAAFAAVNDDFSVATTDGCGVADFIDYGPGAPGGGDNDDYIVIHDYCADGHGVRADLWMQDEYWAGKYNGNGFAGAAVIWDPFTVLPGNVNAGDKLTLRVCLVDGPEDYSGSKCRTVSHTSVDG